MVANRIHVRVDLGVEDVAGTFNALEIWRQQIKRPFEISISEGKAARDIVPDQEILRVEQKRSLKPILGSVDLAKHDK